MGAGVADLLRTGKFTETQLRVGAYAELQLGHTTYWRLRLDRGRQLTRLTNSLRQIFPELSHIFKDLSGMTVQAVIRAGPAAAQLRALSWVEFLARVRAAADGQRLAVSRLRQLYALAPTSIGLTQGVEALWFDVQSSLAHVQLLDQQTRTLLAHLRPVFNGLPEAPFLRSIEGLGEISALGTAGRRGGNGSAGPVRQWQGFDQAGRHPTDAESVGPGPAFQDALLQTRPEPPAAGARLWRWATLRLLSRNAALAHHYRRLQHRAHRPLTKTRTHRPTDGSYDQPAGGWCGVEAVGACMNKLLWYVWHVGHRQELYDPDFWRQTGRRPSDDAIGRTAGLRGSAARPQPPRSRARAARAGRVPQGCGAIAEHHLPPRSGGVDGAAGRG